MKFKKIGMVVLLILFLTPFLSSGQQIDVSKLKNILCRRCYLGAEGTYVMDFCYVYP